MEDRITVGNTLMAGRNSNPCFATALWSLSMFATGACGLVFEYILCTVLTYILGNSVEQFSMTIALMLGMMAVAGYLQRYLRDEGLIEKFIAVEVLIAILGGFAAIALYTAYGFVEDHFCLVQYFFVCIIGFLIGFEIPLVVRINAKFTKTLGVNIAYIYGSDYLGSFAGALIWTYYLLRNFPLLEISFMLAGVNFFIAVVTYGYCVWHRLVSIKISYCFLIMVTCGALFYGYTNNRQWTIPLEQRLYEDRIMKSITTKYQHLVVTYYKARNDWRLFINGNLQFSSIDEDRYHEPLVHPIMNLVPNHGKILVLGGGDGMVLREILKYKDVGSVTLVDLDPAVTDLAANDPIFRRLNGDSFRDARVKVVHSKGVSSDGWRPVFQNTGEEDEDGRLVTEEIAQVEIINIDADKFLTDVQENWNLVIIDLPDPNCVELAKLYSKEFYMKVRNVLAETGMIVVQSTSPYHAKETYNCMMRTIRAAGFKIKPYHVNVPSFGEWGWIMGCKDTGPIAHMLDRRIENLKRIDVETSYLTPESFKASLVFGKGMLNSRFSDVSTLMHPAVYYMYKNEWQGE